MKKSEHKFIILRDDRFWKSVASDTYSAAILVSVTLLGWSVGSSALQWIGGLFAILFMAARATSNAAKSRYTIEQARAELDRLENESA